MDIKMHVSTYVCIYIRMYMYTNSSFAFHILGLWLAPHPNVTLTKFWIHEICNIWTHV